jgi:hypothetical protein
MALSNKAKEALRRAFTEDDSANEVESAINSGANDQAAAVAKLNAAGAAGTDAALVDAANAKIDELIQAMKDAGLMA